MKGISVGRMGLNRSILGIEHMAQRPLLLAALFEAKFLSLLHEKERIKLNLKNQCETERDRNCLIELIGT